MREIESRVVRLEAKRPAFPWHLPLALWTDAQLAHIAAGETEDAR